MRVWLIVIVIFASYGFLDQVRSPRYFGAPFDAHIALEEMLCFATLGIGVATCVVVGLSALQNVRTGRRKKSDAIAAVFIASVSGFVLTSLIIWGIFVVRPWDILQEEDALFAIAGILRLAVLINASVLVVFTIFILTAKRRLAMDGTCPR